jgi:hypothetical protein
MKLRQILDYSVDGYWNGGKKRTFDWSIEWNHRGRDSKGEFVRIGSWCANHWFHVAVGKTEKRTLANAKLHLKRTTKIPCQFIYID